MVVRGVRGVIHSGVVGNRVNEWLEEQPALRVWNASTLPIQKRKLWLL